MVQELPNSVPLQITNDSQTLSTVINSSLSNVVNSSMRENVTDLLPIFMRRTYYQVPDGSISFKIWVERNYGIPKACQITFSQTYDMIRNFPDYHCVIANQWIVLGIARITYITSTNTSHYLSLNIINDDNSES